MIHPDRPQETTFYYNKIASFTLILYIDKRNEKYTHFCLMTNLQAHNLVGIVPYVPWR